MLLLVCMKRKLRQFIGFIYAIFDVSTEIMSVSIRNRKGNDCITQYNQSRCTNIISMLIYYSPHLPVCRTVSLISFSMCVCVCVCAGVHVYGINSDSYLSRTHGQPTLDRNNTVANPIKQAPGAGVALTQTTLT